MTKNLRIGVGVSGGGRSLENLLRAQGDFQFEVSAVFSSARNIGANTIAQKHGIPLLIEDFSKGNSKSAGMNLYKFLTEHRVDLIVLAGFLKLLPMNESWVGRIINIHPALLPKFGGKGMYGHHVHEAVLAANEPYSGATVHFVNDRYDEGSLISQAIVPIAEARSALEVADRVFQVECKLLPWTIGQLNLGHLPKSEVVMFSPEGAD